MEYQVPQFIEVEDRIIGPLTLKQFIYLSGGVGICVLFFLKLPLIFAVLLSAPFAGLAGALAFYKVNGKPFIEIMEAGFNYYVAPKLFLWKHQDAPQKNAAEEIAAIAAAQAEASKIKTEPRLTRGKLSELAWSLDVKQPPKDGSSEL